MRQDAIDDLFKEFYQPLMLYGLSLTRNKGEAEDLVQESFYRLLVSYPEVREATCKQWLIRVVHNLFVDKSRKKSRQEDENFKFKLVIEEQDDPLTAFLINEDRRNVYRQLTRLPQDYQELLFYFYFLELSIKEIEGLTGLKQGQIKTRLFRGRAKLREELKEYE